MEKLKCFSSVEKPLEPDIKIVENETLQTTWRSFQDEARSFRHFSFMCTCPTIYSTVSWTTVKRTLPLATWNWKTLEINFPHHTVKFTVPPFRHSLSRLVHQFISLLSHNQNDWQSTFLYCHPIIFNEELFFFRLLFFSSQDIDISQDIMTLMMR